MANNVASEILLDCAQSMFGTVDATRKVLIQKENFKKYSSFLQEVAFFLQELSKFKVQNFECFDRAVGNLKQEIKVAKHLAAECSNRNQFFLFLSCKRIVKDIESSTNNIGRAMSIFTLETLEVSSETNDRLVQLCKNMNETRYQAPAVEEEILQEIQTGMEDGNFDRSCASNLLVRIAKYLGISTEVSVLKTEFESFKQEMENIESRTESLQMEQIILLLSNADIVTTPKEKKIKYFAKRNSLGRNLLEPLQSFYCPITGDVMVDPVETSSGHTFEKAAIEKWLTEGNNLCPLTKTYLRRTSLRPNRKLLESIEEWKKRNTMISIASMKPEIQSSDENEVLQALERLHEFCKISELHREWIVMEDYVPILTDLLSVKSSELRVRSLAILIWLAKDGDDNKERIVDVNGGTKYIVHSLARKVEESKLALQLLLELSRSRFINCIGGEHGCILLLVTLASSDDAQASECAKEVLDNLASSDENVIQMARANFFGPLLQRLCEGSTSMQMMMADTLADVELTDHNKLRISRDGVLKPLLRMLQHSDMEVKAVAVKALQNLSGVAQNGLQLIKEGGKDPLFELLFCHTLSIPRLREQVAKTIMHLAMSTTSQEAFEDQISLLESEDDIFKLFSLISLTGPELQQTLLLTFQAMCKSSSGFVVRNNLREISAVKVLVQLCELDDLMVRANAVKLIYLLTEDGDHTTFLEHVNKKCITTLITIIKSSDNEEEVAATMGIIAHLPQNFQMSQHMLECGALEIIFDCLTFRNARASHKKEIIEAAAEALCRFTVPSNLEWQKKVAETGIIPVLVKMLASGTSLTKKNLAITLKQFSENSSILSFPEKKSSLLACCFTSPKTSCPLHLGTCSIESSFCLLQAQAVRPLVMVLEEQDTIACEASFDAILTLIDDEQLQNGCKVLEEAGAIRPIIQLLNSPCTKLQEKSLGALHRIFRLADFKLKYGKSAQQSLVDITQRGSSKAKSLAAKVLAQLNILDEQSSFFG